MIYKMTFCNIKIELHRNFVLLIFSLGKIKGVQVFSSTKS